MSRGYSLVAVASLAEHRLAGVWAQQLCGSRLESTGSVAVTHGLSCSSACEIFPTRDGIRVSHIGRHLSFALEGDIISKAVH